MLHTSLNELDCIRLNIDDTDTYGKRTVIINTTDQTDYGNSLMMLSRYNLITTKFNNINESRLPPLYNLDEYNCIVHFLVFQNDLDMLKFAYKYELIAHKHFKKPSLLKLALRWGNIDVFVWLHHEAKCQHDQTVWEQFYYMFIFNEKKKQIFNFMLDQNFHYLADVNGISTNIGYNVIVFATELMKHHNFKIFCYICENFTLEEDHFQALLIRLPLVIEIKAMQFKYYRYLTHKILCIHVSNDLLKMEEVD
jgi:hypothetical protein